MEGIFLPEDGVSSTSVKAMSSSQLENDYSKRTYETEGRIHKTTEWTVLGTEGRISRSNSEVYR